MRLNADMEEPMRKYARPTLLKQERLASVTAGPLPVVTDGQTEVKGGCFQARARKSK